MARRRNRGGVFQFRNIIFLVLIFIIIGGAGFLVYHFEQQENQTTAELERGNSSTRKTLAGLKTIEFNGETYRQRKGLTTLLLMGIDKYAEEEEAPDKKPTYDSAFRHGGQADFLRLMVIDDKNQVVKQIEIDRDTMTPVTVLGVLGNRAGKRTMQICLAHYFGDGKEQSCELTVEAVENLFYGNHIDGYFAMNMDGISELNDWVGGVTVPIEDDFTAIDPSMYPGATVHLVGDQAELFVRERMSIGIGTNEARMRRQQVFMSNLQDMLINKIKSESDAADDLYDYLMYFFITNMSKGRLVNALTTAVDYEIQDPVSIDGEHVEKEYMEFYIDENSLEQVMIDTFYEKVS